MRLIAAWRGDWEPTVMSAIRDNSTQNRQLHIQLQYIASGLAPSGYLRPFEAQVMRPIQRGSWGFPMFVGGRFRGLLTTKLTSAITIFETRNQQTPCWRLLDFSWNRPRSAIDRSLNEIRFVAWAKRLLDDRKTFHVTWTFRLPKTVRFNQWSHSPENMSIIKWQRRRAQILRLHFEVTWRLQKFLPRLETFIWY